MAMYVPLQKQLTDLSFCSALYAESYSLEMFMLFQSTFDLGIILCHSQANDIHGFSHPPVATAHKTIVTNSSLTAGGKTILGFINSTEYKQ